LELDYFACNNYCSMLWCLLFVKFLLVWIGSSWKLSWLGFYWGFCCIESGLFDVAGGYYYYYTVVTIWGRNGAGGEKFISLDRGFIFMDWWTLLRRFGEESCFLSNCYEVAMFSITGNSIISCKGRDSFVSILVFWAGGWGGGVGIAGVCYYIFGFYMDICLGMISIGGGAAAGTTVTGA
jgi:hypothetical protein